MALVQWRTDVVGAPVHLVALAPDGRGFVAVDADSGTLVRAAHPGLGPAVHPFDVLRGVCGPADDALVDPTQPESLALTGPPEKVGRLDRRRAERLVRPLLHPMAAPLLGEVGPDVAYWDHLDGTRPSVSVVEPLGGVAVRGGEAHFWWRGLAHVLPLVPHAPVAHVPGRLVVAYGQPVAGRCPKVALAVLPA